MIITMLERERFNKIHVKAFNEICKLNNKADSLWDEGANEDALRRQANVLYEQADKIYKREVLLRKFK